LIYWHFAPLAALVLGCGGDAGHGKTLMRQPGLRRLQL